MGVVRDAVRGGVAGGVATWLMDLVTTGMADGQSAASKAREKRAQPNGKPALENTLDWLQGLTSMDLSEDQRGTALQVMHYGLGIVPGAMYGVLRNRVPLVGAFRGLLYGATLFAMNDEFINTSMGWAGPFDAYPMDTHLRGLVGHLALGLATDTGIAALGG